MSFAMIIGRLLRKYYPERSKIGKKYIRAIEEK